jgi:hypothetical protein
MSSALAQANREPGLRMALGAGDRFRQVISRGLRFTAGGSGAARLRGWYGRDDSERCPTNVSPNDPLAFTSAVAVRTITSVAVWSFCLLAGYAYRSSPRVPILILTGARYYRRGFAAGFPAAYFLPDRGIVGILKESQPGIARRFTHDMSR